MSLELLKPLKNSFLNEIDENYLQGSLYNKIKIHSESDGLPNHELFDVCLVGVEAVSYTHLTLPTTAYV